MHYYKTGNQRDLEERLASAELALDVAWDEIERGRGREQRLCLVVLGFAAVAVIAIIKVTWMAMGR